MEFNEQENKDLKKVKTIGIIILIIVIIWSILGIWAFIWSIVCFGKNNNTTYNIIGLVLAIFFGPFYWLYYLINKSYCREY